MELLITLAKFHIFNISPVVVLPMSFSLNLGNSAQAKNKKTNLQAKVDGRSQGREELTGFDEEGLQPASTRHAPTEKLVIPKQENSYTYADFITTGNCFAFSSPLLCLSLHK